MFMFCAYVRMYSNECCFVCARLCSEDVKRATEQHQKEPEEVHKEPNGEWHANAQPDIEHIQGTFYAMICAILFTRVCDLYDAR